MNRLSARMIWPLAVVLLLIPGREALHAQTPPAAERFESVATLRPQTKHMRHLAPRDRWQHTFFADAGYSAVLTALYIKRSTSGSLNEGRDIRAGYNITSPRGFGAGIVYSGGFFSARRDGFTRRSRLHYVAPEFVARQRAGRRWLFRESAGIGYGCYIRSYRDRKGSRCGLGIHESAFVEYMLTRHIGLGAGIGAQWLFIGAPDVDDGAEFHFAGIFRFQFDAGVRLYF